MTSTGTHDVSPASAALPSRSDICHLFALTDLATCALVVEGTESDGGEEDGDVEEDGRGHVLQQGFIAANDT